MKSAKYIIILFAAALLGLASCGHRNTNKQGTHTHEDGSSHGDHATEQTAVPAQESFKVEADSTAVEATPTDHGHSHDHSGDDHGHQH